MSQEFPVKVVKINEILVHPKADRLEIAVIAGWNCVVQKESYRPGDCAVYLPIDSLLPKEVEDALFPPDSKIKLKNSRVRTIKIRGAISQGMLAKPEILGLPADLPEGTDVKEQLNISKYEPPETSMPSQLGMKKVKKKKVNNPNFFEYGGLDNFKHHPSLFEAGEQVCITEKVHGSNARYALLPNPANTLWKKFLKLLGLHEPLEFCFGSNRVQLQRQANKKTFYAENVYAKMAKQYGFKNFLKPGETVYGEIIGDGIQKNYAYGCGQGEHRFVVFDLMVNGEYVDHDVLVNWCAERNLEMVPVLYRGPYDEKIAKDLTKGNSVYCPQQKVREGVVIRPEKETKCHLGRKLLKLISDQYLLNEDNTDWH